jgi:hypothetical protein
MGYSRGEYEDFFSARSLVYLFLTVFDDEVTAEIATHIFVKGEKKGLRRRLLRT